MARKPHHDSEEDAIKPGKEGGEKIFKPRAFNIVWGNDKRYWRIPPRSQSSNNNDEEFAELVQVSWLEIRAVSKELRINTQYQITFKISFKSNAYGWSGSPVFLMAKVGFKGRYKWKKLKELEKEKNLPRQPIEVPSDAPFLVEVKGDTIDRKLYFGLYEVWSGKWKRGLRVHEAIVKPYKPPSPSA